MRKLSIVLLLAVAAIAFAGEKKKPQAYAVIIGTVFAPDQRPASGVVLTVRRADQKKAKWQVRSDARGEFALRLPPGKADYIIRPELQDPQAGDASAVTVQIEKDERRDINLHLKQQEHTKK